MPKNNVHELKTGRKQYRYTDVSGRRHTLTQRKTETVKEFKARCEREEAIATCVDMDANLTFDELFRRWEEEHQLVYCSKADIRATRPVYEKHVKNIIGHLKIGKITRADVRRVLLPLAKQDYSQSSIAKARMCISRPYNWAAANLHFDVPSPTVGVSVKAVEKNNPSAALGVQNYLTSRNLTGRRSY